MKQIPRDQLSMKSFTQDVIKPVYAKEDERRVALEEAKSKTEDILTRCPFCLRSQNLREMVILKDNSVEASKMRRCKFSRDALKEREITEVEECPKNGKMQNLTAIIWLKGAKQFGIHIGYYDGFWQIVDHDKWLASLKDIAFKANAINLKDFWNGYAEARPKFAEKRKAADAERQYAEAEGFRDEEQDTDEVDEGGR